MGFSPETYAIIAGKGGKANGFATLNENGKVPASQIPSDTFSRPNLLDNWYFVGGGSQQGGGQFPINQRGQTSYTGTGYKIDRWTSQSVGTLEITSEGVNFGKVISPSNYNLTMQTIEANMSAYVGREFTLSFLTPTGLYTGTGILSTSYVYATTGTSYMRFFYSSVMNRICVEIVSLTDFLVQAAKLELGDTQTLAHKENGVWVLNEIPNYEEQLIRCKSSTADSSDTYANDPVAFKSAIDHNGVYIFPAQSGATIDDFFVNVENYVVNNVPVGAAFTAAVDWIDFATFFVHGMRGSASTTFFLALNYSTSTNNYFVCVSNGTLFSKVSV